MSDAATSRRTATYEDIRTLPSHVVGELLAGELVVQPRPAGPRAIASSAAGGTLIPPFQFGDGGPGGWWIIDEPELHLEADVLVPDLAGWKRDRMPAPPTGAFFDLAPDWVCEVISPSTARVDRVIKMAIYARHGVSHAWLLDPLARTLEVFGLESGRWVMLSAHGDDAIVRAAPFDAVAIDLLRLWGESRA